MTSAGYTLDFVGTENILSNNSSLQDPDHEGFGGFEIGAVDAVVDGALDAIEDPDVIMLLIGTNDFAGNNDVTNAKNRLENLIAHVATLRPYAKIIVANLLLRYDLPSADEQIRTLFNPYIPGIVDHQVSLGRQVSFVDLRSSCAPEDFVDGLHPTLGGYDKIAETWFDAIGNVISPTGTTNAPALVRAAGQVDLTHVVVTFSKPVEDAAASVANFSLSGGLSILQAELDPGTKRVVTLTTSPQARAIPYTLTVNGVRDRTPQQNQIAPNSTAAFVSKNVAEAANYKLVYSLKIPNQSDFNWRGVPYTVDNHATAGAFSRIAYYIELKSPGGSLQYLWVSMDAFTTDASKIGVPTVQSGAFFQQAVANMNVSSSMLPSATGVAGRLEFWPGNYGPGNDASVPNASSDLYDFGDGSVPGTAGYGSMQVHQTAGSRTVFAFNGWGGVGFINDLGIGNNSSGQHPDWTFAQNAAGYFAKTLQVYVLPASTPPSTPVIQTQPSNLSAPIGSTASFSVVANGAGLLSYQWRFNGQPIPGAIGPDLTINNVQASNGGSYDVVVTNSSGSTTSSAAVLTVVSVGVLANGSFESGYSGWMASGNQEIVSNGGFYQASDGANLVVFNGGNTIPNAPLSQSFATTAGQAYTLTLDVGVLAFNYSEQRLQVSAEGARTLLWRTISVFGNGSGTTTWVPKSFSFIADSGTTTVTFLDLSPTTTGLDLVVDNVQVQAEGPVLRTATIQSLNPSSSVSVNVSPLDSNGAGNGVTSFTRTFTHGTLVTLTAPTTAAGNGFAKWQKNGVDYSFNPSITATADGDHTFTAVYVSAVTAAHVFYNNSAWDGNDGAANVNDDQAIATDKSPLRRGQSATAANYTSYAAGLNGILVDVSSVPGTPTVNDFLFKVGNDNNPNAWVTAPAPTITLRRGGGSNGSDRITLIWPANGVQKQWLEVTVLATPNTGLGTPDIFYFGNAIGEALNSASDAKVDPADELLARANPRTVFNPAPITFPYDYNRDKRVDPGDQLITRANQTTVFNALKLIDLSGVGPSGWTAGESSNREVEGTFRTASPSNPSGPMERPLTWRIVRFDGGRSLVLEVTNQGQQRYWVEATESLEMNSWSTLVLEPFEEDGPLTRWLLPLRENTPQQFYRIVVDQGHVPR